MISLLLNKTLAVTTCNPNTDNPNHPFFGFPHWWQYVNTGERDFFGHCQPVVKFPEGIWAIAFAVTSMLLYLAGLVAVFMIITAGIQYMLASGNPETAKKAKSRLTNAIIGLVIVFFATPIISFIGTKLG